MQDYYDFQDAYETLLRDQIESAGNRVDGDYAAYRNADFGDGAGAVEARVGAVGAIELRLGNFDGAVVGRVEVPRTGGWQQWTTVIAPAQANGVHDLYAVFAGGVHGIVNLNRLRFLPTSQHGTEKLRTGKEREQETR